MSRDILNQYHRAGKRFAEALEKNREAERLREKLAQNGRQSEKLSGVYYDVHIEEDWISRIERGIPHLEAAIREDRQFIKTEGNVTPIERVRKVSRSSVEHLARHSEMITHKPAEGVSCLYMRLSKAMEALKRSASAAVSSSLLPAHSLFMIVFLPFREAKSISISTKCLYFVD